MYCVASDESNGRLLLQAAWRRSGKGEKEKTVNETFETGKIV